LKILWIFGVFCKVVQWFIMNHVIFSFFKVEFVGLGEVDKVFGYNRR